MSKLCEAVVNDSEAGDWERICKALNAVESAAISGTAKDVLEAIKVYHDRSEARRAERTRPLTEEDLIKKGVPICEGCEE